MLRICKNIDVGVIVEVKSIELHAGVHSSREVVGVIVR